MAEYKVTRSFGGNARGSKVDLSGKDAKVMVDAGYVEATGSAPAKKAAGRKRAAKKTAAQPAAGTSGEQISES